MTPLPHATPSARTSSVSTMAPPMSPSDERTLLLSKQIDRDASGFHVPNLHTSTDDGWGDEDEEEDADEGSTWLQALWNAIGDLVGTGLLATPIAIAYCGWILGPLLLLFLAFLTHRTLLILVQMSLDDRTVVTYIDIVCKAFEGKLNIRPALSALFVFEVLAWTVALIILVADNTNSVFPYLSVTSLKLLSFFIILPTTFLPLRLLSFSSFLGVLSSAWLVAIILANGFSSMESPGSILNPAETSLWPWPGEFGLAKIGVAIGLLMSGFGGHSIMPTIINDMKDKTHWRLLVDVSYLIALVVCGGVGTAGYLMFGQDVSEEISLDIAHTTNLHVLSIVAVWMVALNSLTKTPMALRLLNDVTEISLSIYPSPKPALPRSKASSTTTTRVSTRASSPSGSPHKPISTPSSSNAIPNSPSIARLNENGYVVSTPILRDNEDLLAEWRARERKKAGWRVLTKSLILAGLVVLSILIPSFETILGFMGSIPAFLVTCIIPLLAKKSLYASRSSKLESAEADKLPYSSWGAVLDWCLLVASAGMAGLGVYGSVFSS